MRKSKCSADNPARPKRMLIKTTFLELIANLIDSTPDDAQLMATVKRIFAISDVRVIRSLAPLQLDIKGNHRAKFAKAKPAWA